MDFFEHQARARRNTAWLVTLYAIAVVAIIAAVDIVLALFWASQNTFPAGGVPPVVHWGALGLVLAVILVATVRKVFELAEGGHAVAMMIGARPVLSDTRDLRERRLLNVVEEMAIASGTAVPGVYVMNDERSINAFAAGYRPNAAVIAVTRGALEQLNRDELQGVIGHEFSHILNGDMRLNVRMLGVLHGISALGSIGRFMVRGGSDSSRSRNRSGGAVMLGLALWAIGSIGVLFARLIKAAVSRQREYLADSASVQFTRNPDAVAGALDRIAATGAGTLVDHRHAEELSHMFFGQSVKMWLAGLMDTHPPLADRIRRVSPGFVPRRYRGARSDEIATTAAGDEADHGTPGATVAFAGAAGRAPPPAEAATTLARRVVATVGRPSPAHVLRARDLLDHLPAALHEMCHSRQDASALALGLILARDPAARDAQARAIEAAGAPDLVAGATSASVALDALGPGMVLPLFDLATPALKSLPATERGRVLAALRAAIVADGRVTVRELALLTIAQKRLAAHADHVEPTGSARITDLQEEVLLLLSLLARAGTHDARWAGIAFERGTLALKLEGGATQLVPMTVGLARVPPALARLRTLAPAHKGRLLEACLLTVTADDRLALAEAELVRMIASELDCPLPPVLESALADPA